MNRLLIYFFHDEEGVVDDYVVHCLNGLRAHCRTVMVVVNGRLNDEGRFKLDGASDILLTRENKGLDAWAYKEALSHYGFDELKQFGEVLVTNFTLFGPLFDLSELFTTMDAKSCDFWGLTKCNDRQDGRERLHLQSYFVAYRKSLLSSPEFKRYWDELPPIESDFDAVQRHELRQTPFFAERGFTFDSYAPIEKYKDISPHNFIIARAERHLVEDRSPFIKRRVFYYDRGIFQPGVSLDKVRYIANFIKGHTDYDIELIFKNLVRTQHKHRRGLKQLLKWFLASKLYPSKEIRKYCALRLREPSTYLDCFRKTKLDPVPFVAVRPNLQNVGRRTYAHTDICVVNKYSVIGDFCSIGQRVIVGHGEHPQHFLSTSPYFYFDEFGMKRPETQAFDGYWHTDPVIIGNDVWIGDGAFIKNGVTIGDGAIVGAHTVVTKNVPPYAIVAGNPAKVLRYRFDEAVVNELLTLKWWELPDDVIRQIPFDDIHRAVDFIRAARAEDMNEDARSATARAPNLRLAS
ncbi:MAG: rhamnan synthesis F family protein [Hyphomicrobium sp.]|jgi:lipopolysaccharide biosynthesis protein